VHAGYGAAHDHGRHELAPALLLQSMPYAQAQVGEQDSHHNRCGEQHRVVAHHSFNMQSSHAGIVHGADPRAEQKTSHCELSATYFGTA